MNEFIEDITLRNNGDIRRVSSGIKELDDLLSGGFPNNTITLVSGTPGSGKTILCFHYLKQGLKNNEKCLFLTSDERVENIIKQANEIGFNFQRWIDSDRLRFMYLDLDKPTMHKEMEREIRNGGYKRIVLDSLTPVSEVPVWVGSVQEVVPSEHREETHKYPAGSTPAIRMHVKRILSLLSRENCTGLVTSEIPEGSRNLSRDSISEFLVDGIILLDLDMTMDRRKLTVRKMRATKHTLKPQNITITTGGIKFV